MSLELKAQTTYEAQEPTYIFLIEYYLYKGGAKVVKKTYYHKQSIRNIDKKPAKLTQNNDMTEIIAFFLHISKLNRTLASPKVLRHGYAIETPHYSRPLSRGSKSCISQNLIVL